MKSLIFDAGPIISLATNNLLWILKPLKKEFNGNFYITKAVKSELVDMPLETKKFKFEAIQVEKQIETGILKIMSAQDIFAQAQELQTKANNLFEANRQSLNIVQLGEMEGLAASILYETEAFVTDERITRLLVEKPLALKNLLEKRLHTKIKISEELLSEFEKKVRHTTIIRSVELVTVAYEEGLLDKFIVKLPNPKKELLEGILWGLKLNGCGISEQEIEEILKMEAHR